MDWVLLESYWEAAHTWMYSRSPVEYALMTSGAVNFLGWLWFRSRGRRIRELKRQLSDVSDMNRTFRNWEGNQNSRTSPKDQSQGGSLPEVVHHLQAVHQAAMTATKEVYQQAQKTVTEAQVSANSRLESLQTKALGMLEKASENLIASLVKTQDEAIQALKETQESSLASLKEVSADALTTIRSVVADLTGSEEGED